MKGSAEVVGYCTAGGVGFSVLKGSAEVVGYCTAGEVGNELSSCSNVGEAVEGSALSGRVVFPCNTSFRELKPGNPVSATGNCGPEFGPKSGSRFGSSWGAGSGVMASASGATFFAASSTGVSNRLSRRSRMLDGMVGASWISPASCAANRAGRNGEGGAVNDEVEAVTCGGVAENGLGFEANPVGGAARFNGGV